MDAKNFLHDEDRRQVRFARRHRAVGWNLTVADGDLHLARRQAAVVRCYRRR